MISEDEKTRELEGCPKRTKKANDVTMSIDESDLPSLSDEDEKGGKTKE